MKLPKRQAPAARLGGRRGRPANLQPVVEVLPAGVRLLRPDWPPEAVLLPDLVLRVGLGGAVVGEAAAPAFFLYTYCC